MIDKAKEKIKQLLGSAGHEPDWVLILSAGIIIIFGLIMLSSATSAVAYNKFHDSYYFFKNQVVGLAIGAICFLFFARMDYHLLRRFAPAFLVISIFLLLLVFIPGLSAHYGKARSWINIFGFSLQPSELVKLSFLFYLAAWLEARRKKNIMGAEMSKPFFIMLGIISILLLLQPDLGTLSIIIGTSVAVYLVGGGSLKHIFIIAAVGILGLLLMMQFKPYQLDRFKCLYDIDSNPAKCYQVKQSLIAVGSGGIFGRGLGQSRQKFMYVPEVSGDSIFPIIGEETGFIFSFSLISLFALFFYRGYKIAKSASDLYGANLAIGISVWLFGQAMINIGGMINLMPMTGVPLPLVSYGGSAMMAALAGVGVLVNISKQTRGG